MSRRNALRSKRRKIALATLDAVIHAWRYPKWPSPMVAKMLADMPIRVHRLPYGTGE